MVIVQHMANTPYHERKELYRPRNLDIVVRIPYHLKEFAHMERVETEAFKNRDRTKRSFLGSRYERIGRIPIMRGGENIESGAEYRKYRDSQRKEANRKAASA